MASALQQQQQQQKQPSLQDDDFEVIEGAPPSFMSQFVVNAPHSDTPPSEPTMSTISSITTTPEQLTDQVSAASERVASLRATLAGANTRLAGLLQAAVRSSGSRRSPVSCQQQAAIVQHPAPGSIEFEDCLRLRLELERAAGRGEGADAYKQRQEQMEQRVCELQEQLESLQDFNKKLKLELKQTEEHCIEVQRRHVDELDDLRRNSHVRRLEDLRLELEQLRRREDELNRLYGESDQTVNDIIRAAEDEKLQMQAKIERMERQCLGMESGVTEISRKLEEATDREMTHREEADRLSERLRHVDEEHRLEMRRMQEELRNLQHRCQAELDGERKLSLFRDTSLQERGRDLETAHGEIARLTRLTQDLTKACQENDQTVNDILATAEKDKKAMQRQLEREAELRTAAEAQLQLKSAALSESLDTVANLRRHSESQQSARVAAERQYQDCRAKCDEAIRVADQIRSRLQAEVDRAARLENELNSLRVEHTSVRASYSDMEHSLTDFIAKEHDCESRASQAEETASALMGTANEYREAFERERHEKEALRKERDSLLDQLQRVRSAFNNFG